LVFVSVRFGAAQGGLYGYEENRAETWRLAAAATSEAKHPARVRVLLSSLILERHLRAGDGRPGWMARLF